MDGYWKVYFETKGKPYEEFVKELSKETSKCIWYYHPNGKAGKGPHVHGLVFNWRKSDDTLRNYLKKEFNLDGTKQEFAVSSTYKKGTKMTELTVPGYISYMTKGKYNPIVMKDYEQDYIDKLKSEWVDPTVRVNEVITLTKEKSKITEFDLQLEAEDLLWGPNDHDKLISKEDIYDTVIKVLKKHRKLAHYRRVANICQAIYARFHPVDARHAVLKMF